MSENKVKAFSAQSLCPHPESRKIVNMLEYSQVPVQCPSDSCRIKMKISVGNFLNDIENENKSIRSKTCPSATSWTLDFHGEAWGATAGNRDDRRASNRLSQGAGSKWRITIQRRQRASVIKTKHLMLCVEIIVYRKNDSEQTKRLYGKKQRCQR